MTPSAISRRFDSAPHKSHARTDDHDPPARRRSFERGSRNRRQSFLHPRYTFANFVVGGSNQFTHAACRAVAERPGHAYNPLFIFAGSGPRQDPSAPRDRSRRAEARREARVCYLSAERFTNEMIYSIQHAQTLAFRNKYRNVDVLLIDDVQFLAGKESTQEEFFYTFNALRDAHKQIVVTADKPPKDIPMLEERLTSRFNQGLVSDIKQPDLETRLAILHKRCTEEGEGTQIPTDLLLLLADRIRNNVRDLEGCLVRVAGARLAPASGDHSRARRGGAPRLRQSGAGSHQSRTHPLRGLRTPLAYDPRPCSVVGGHIRSLFHVRSPCICSASSRSFRWPKLADCSEDATTPPLSMPARRSPHA